MIRAYIFYVNQLRSSIIIQLQLAASIVANCVILVSVKIPQQQQQQKSIKSVNVLLFAYSL